MKNELLRCSPESVGVSSQAVWNLIDALEGCGFSEMHSLMIMRDGKVFAEGWWAPYVPGRAHICWSVSKTYTATAIGIAVTEGVLSLDDRLVDIFPEYAPELENENLSALKVRHLLSMSVGMKEMGPEGEGWLENFMKMKVDYQPGTVFMYNSMGSNTLGAIIHKVTGQTMDEYLRHRLYDKIGMNTEQLYWTIIPGNYEWGAGGVFSTTENNLRLMQLYLQKGIWNGERILSEEYVKLATTPQINNTIAYFPDGMQVSSGPDGNAGYGYQMWMCSYDGAFRAEGSQGQFSIVFPKENMVVAINQTCPDKDTQNILKIIYDVLLPGVKQEILPENPDLLKKLRLRLKKLALPVPDYRPFSTIANRISGKSFHISEGAFTFLTGFEPREYKGTGIRVSGGIQSFTMEFSSRSCMIKYFENDLPYEVRVALDGTRAANQVIVPKHTPKEVLLSGAWTKDNLFEVKARWIETTVEKSVYFCFEENHVEIMARLTTGTLGAYVQPDEVAHGEINIPTMDIQFMS
ncbi:serine hydrolase domain-containing protein [Brevibacillus sp. NRS-1366]|uniref:serine hydrolase domain-containing protein n=1 Tax=Brevibacillus sp. NRS-1366 TaxID=3233899 RepID=UPI003D1C373C